MVMPDTHGMPISGRRFAGNGFLRNARDHNHITAT